MFKRLHTYRVILLLSVSIFITTESLTDKFFKANRKPEFDSLFELTGAVSDLITHSLIQCLAECFTNNRCLTFFYNSDTGRCVMHSRDFIYQVPYVTDTGWKFYITEDVSGRCPTPNYYYRYLDFCYSVEQAVTADFSNVQAICTNKGSSLATIRSQQYQNYFVHMLEGRPTTGVCLAGTVRLDDMVELDGGSVLSYYNWESGEPNAPGSQKCLLMYGGDRWHDAPCNWSGSCVSLCEVK